MVTRIGAALVVMGLFARQSLSEQTHVAEGRLKLAVSENVDERVVIVSMLWLSHRWLADLAMDSFDNTVAPSECRRLLQNIVALKQRTADAKLDPELTDAFDACAQAAIKFGEMLDKVKSLHEINKEQNSGDIPQETVGRRNLGEMRPDLKGHLTKPRHGGVEVNLPGLSNLLGTFKTLAASEQFRRYAKVAAVDDFLRAYETSFQGAVTTARKISDRHGWRRKTAILDMPLEDANALDRAIAAADFPAVQTLFAELCERSPVDPLIRLHRIDILSTVFELPEETNRQLIGECLKALELVPQEREYDIIRSDLLSACGFIALRIGEFERSRGEEGEKSIALSSAAFRTALDYRAVDVGGSLRSMLAMSLSTAGKIEEAELVSKAAVARHPNQPLPHLARAIALGMHGEPTSGFVQLEKSVESGLFNFLPRPDVLTEPLLQSFRDADDVRFSSIVKLKTEWNIVDREEHDDVTLANNGPYPITNVTLAIELRKGDQHANLVLTEKQINAHTVKTWSKCVRGTDGPWGISQSKAELACDQDP